MRPRAFDEARALDAAMDVFWRDGYQGASLASLTKAMGINRPSLYAAFGDKRSLFGKVLDRYESGPAARVREALAEPSAKETVRLVLRRSIELTTSRHHPRGCLMVQAALAGEPEDEEIRRELVRRRGASENAIRHRLVRARAEGQLPADADCADLARYFATVVRGIAVQAASGARQRDLERVAEISMKAWPANSS